ncbi:uncharacterized protein LOC110709364 [Chenopodium quinoa]|uniref:uncharacterized protein LOC110709364 n=1 Tax=Chenopodium quinoa TaxID=63459 RepID=UPI000B78F605|nr:uncharacterized protein LOC110709364 [Chenopodium quinoa]
MRSLQIPRSGAFSDVREIQETYGPIEEMIPPAREDQRFVERFIPCHQTRFSREVVTLMARCIDAFRSQLVRMRNVASCRRDHTVREGHPIPSRTWTRPEVLRDSARSSSRHRRTTSGGRGGRSDVSRTEAVEGSGSSSESAQVGPMGQEEATLAPRGGGMYEVGSLSHQPPQPQPLLIHHQGDLGWTGPELSFPPPVETRAGGEHTPRSAQFFDMMNILHHLGPPTP